MHIAIWNAYHINSSLYREHFSYLTTTAASQLQKFISAVKMKNSTSYITYISKNLACNFFNMEHFAYTVNINAYRNMKRLPYKQFFISRTFFISDYHSRISATKIHICCQNEKFNTIHNVYQQKSRVQSF